MTVRPWNDRASGGAEAAPVVLILKKTQGSVWSEAGKTPLCPTVGWLRDTYGAGSYELRLKLGNRIVCMAKAECTPPLPTPPLPTPPLPTPQASPAASRSRLLDPPLFRTATGAW